MAGQQEPEVTLESIDSALQDLVKAAGATDLSKAYGGVAVEGTGHVDERGKNSGGFADKGDVGGIDKMMIAKMTESLVDAGYDAASIAAYMKGKQEDEEEEEGDEEMEGKMSHKGKMADVVTPTDARMNDDDDDDDMGKSYDAFVSDQSIQDAVDVSPFLEGLVQRTAEQLDGLAKSMRSQGSRQDEVNRTMAGAVYGIGQMVKSMAPVLQALDSRLQLVERTPNAPKGRTQVPGRMAKSFGQSDQLTKSDVLRTLSYMNLEKGIRDIGGRPTHEIVSLYEGGGALPQQALHAVHRFLSSNPSEAQAALTYR